MRHKKVASTGMLISSPSSLTAFFRNYRAPAETHFLSLDALIATYIALSLNRDMVTVKVMEIP